MKRSCVGNSIMNFRYPKIVCVYFHKKNDHLTVIFNKQVLNRSSEGILKKYISLAHQRGEFGGLEISFLQEIKYHPEYN